jgi:hypothetical protein
MPTYSFKNKETGDIADVKMPMAELDAFKARHPEVEQVIVSSTPEIVSGVDGTRKWDTNFRELMTNIKKHAGRKNTINIR